MNKLSFFIALLLLVSSALFAQVSINADGTQPDPSAGLDVKFNNKGFLLPRLSVSQIQAISNPVNGLVVFCTTDNKFYAYITSTNTWKEIMYSSGIIIPPFSCGFSFIKTHMAGTIAPVTKTVTYWTVTNIPGEPTKCWITSNLGADHQATAVNDATEASAGWYWQFNRQQGYKHDGTTRTPNTTWITSISEDLDWQAANDPCTLELGSGWRIPTSTEWSNVDASGNWTDWNGPWNSGLKMHASGELVSSSGSLNQRGLTGYYRSITQISSTNGRNLNFNSAVCEMSNDLKAEGYSLRCIRD